MLFKVVHGNTKYTNLPAVRWAELNGIQDPFLSDGE